MESNELTVGRGVINDLLPAYFSGEASADTRLLVDNYFAQFPDFALEARRGAAPLAKREKASDIRLDSALEKRALQRSKRILRARALLLALASTFSLNAISIGFSFEIENGHARIHWLSVPGQLQVVVGLCVLAAVFWTLYIVVRRRVKAQILG